MKAVKWFAEQMRAKLEEGDPDWNLESMSYLLEEMAREVEQLDDAVFKSQLPADIISEAVSVANRAMMIADNVRAHSKTTYDCPDAVMLGGPLELARPEAATIDEVVEAMNKQRPGLNFFVCDDGSSISWAKDEPGVSHVEFIPGPGGDDEKAGG